MVKSLMKTIQLQKPGASGNVNLKEETEKRMRLTVEFLQRRKP